MEQSLSSFTFKGSIPEAISDAKIQKKLFVVYISGEGEDSIRMENSTWADHKVSESISKYCIFLHIAEGSSDAANFSMIYPQKCVPCITAVGHNGVQIWQHEGFIDAENLTSSLEKAWLSLHVQETTASIMAAALAGRSLESSTSQAFPVASNEQGRSSSTAPPPSNGSNYSSEATASPLIKEKGVVGESVKESTSSAEPLKESSSSLLVETHGSGRDIQYSNMENECPSSEAKEKHSLEITEGSDNQYSNMGNDCPASEAKEKHFSEITEGSISTQGSLGLVLSDEKVGPVEEINETDKMQTLPSSSKLSDVHLSIRLPDGISLQDKFPVTSTLRIVKDYVDENQPNGYGSYDLAIPYPRKVFNDQDLSKSLEELELLGRQALIVVPRQRGRSNNSREGVPICYTQPDSSAADSEGYFAFARRVLSYLNPFSYLGGGGAGSGAPSRSGHDSNAGTMEYRPNTNLRDNYVAQGRPYSQDSTSQDTIRSRKPTSSQFGSNIHTLKHDDDETRFKDRNSFWNGNSTQYGGDNSDSR